VDHSLPTPLAERIRWVVPPLGQSQQPGEYILYWMHNALRAHENPALDTAICLARQNGLPLLVYHALSEDYPAASDRHHAFILQGARDVQRELADRGISAFFHVQRDGHRGPHLRTLTRAAAAVVTEEMPTQPISGWLERLTQITSTPIACVDTSCILPMTHLKKRYTRAFQFRGATQEEYARRVDLPYQEQAVDTLPYDGLVPFEPIDLQDQCLASLIADCRIDHAVAPVAETVGGSRAGYRRWESFCRQGLDQYARQRTDASLQGGTSRMSAYLHYGMVSPFRIAREASARSATKFLDELLIWRELAFHFCFHHVDLLDSMEALPDWAKATLEAHAHDPRPAHFSWETLYRGQTGQPLWDACQRSLLRHGELHNNLRMTWGKALLSWTRCPGLALQQLRDLNHRLALDARDPCSYGGILWCLGQFDRPFEPEQPILGRVRDRSITEHQQRINFTRYRRLVDRPIAGELPSVAIIGAGLAGLMAGRTLIDHGLAVQVFEKSRSVGGRLATKQLDCQRWFDHGAQYFTVRDCRFGKYVKSWMADGWVEPWLGRIVELGPGGTIIADKTKVPRYVGVPGMNQLAQHLAGDVPIQRKSPIAEIRRTPQETWQLFGPAGNLCGEYDIVICNAPPVQSLALLKNCTELAAEVAAVDMRPCWAALVTTRSTLETEAPERDFAGAFVNQGPLCWLSRDSSKPGRLATDATVTGPVCRWVLHASPQWSQTHLEADQADVARELMTAMPALLGCGLEFVGDVITHRWRYANPIKPIDRGHLWDATNHLGVCGDWCGGGRVEGAFLSGLSIAGTILRHHTIDRTPSQSPPHFFQPSLLG